MAKISVRNYVQAPSEIVLRVLRDYERFDEWLPGVAFSKLLAIEEGAAIVELRGPGLDQKPLLLEIKGEAPLTVRRVGRYRRRGGTALIRVANRPDDQGCEVRVRIEDGLPPFRGFLRRRQLARRVEELLHSLDVRSQTAASGWIVEGARKSTKILEIRRAEEGLTVVFRGETFRLVTTSKSPQQTS